MKIYSGYPGGITKITNGKDFYQTEDLSNVITVYVDKTNLTGITYSLTLEFLRADNRKTTLIPQAFEVGDDTTLTEDGVTYDIHNFVLTDSQLAVAGTLAFTCYITIFNNSNVVVSRGALFNAVSNVRKTVTYSANTIFVVSEDDEDVPIIVADMKTAIETLAGQLASKVNKADVADNLTTNDSDKVLSAKQGYILKSMLDALEAATYTKTETNTLLAQKQDNLTFDSTPIANSTNPVTSGGVKTALDAKADSTTVSGIDNRVGALENEITDLQSVQNVVDVVATKSALGLYDTSKLEENDKIQVIADETHDGASTVYNWNGSAWQYVGAYGTNSYTKTEINNYKKMWDNLVYSCEFTIDDSAKTMTISGNWAFTKYSFIVIDNIAVKTISYASLSLGNYCLVIRNNALEFVNFANAIQDGDMVLWIGFLDGTGDIRTDIYRCNNKVTNLALYCSDNIKIDTTNKNFVIANSYLFWNSGYASITAQNISYASYLNATCVLVYRNGVFKVLGLQNIELFYNDVIVAVVWFRGDGFPLSKIYVVNEAPDKAITELPLSSKIFMRVGVIGDSYTSGWIKDNDHKNNPNYSWVKHMKQLTGNEWTNFGVSGSSTKSWVDGTLGQLPQVQNKGNKCQAYVIGLMINDQNQGMQTYVPLGTSSDIGTNANSYYAYYYKLINALLSVNSSAIIFCNTCPRTDGDFPSYNQAVIDVVNYCQNESKNVYLVELRNYYWRNETFNNDALNGHYTAIGYEYMAEIFNKAFSDTINANASSLKEVNLIPYDSATVYDYVDQKINDLRWELGSHTLDVTTDSDTKYLKSVPSGAIGCQINTLGGMSYKNENLLNIADVSETTTNGITYKVENGVITVSGTATTETNIIFTNLNRKVLNQPFIFATLNNTSYNDVAIMAINFINDSGYTFTLGQNAYRKFTLTDKVLESFRLKINAGASLSNMVLKPMVVESDNVPTTWSEYFSGIRDSAVTSVVSKDSNNTTINTLEIPTAIQNLTGYGQSNPDDTTQYNYIDFINKTFVRVGYIENDEWVTSALTTDISAYLTNDTIDVEPLGTLEFTNTYSQDVPSDIDYLIEEVKA